MALSGGGLHFSEEHSLHPRRLRILVKRNWRLLAIIPAACMAISIVGQLFDIPHFASSSKVQLQSYTLGKLMGDSVLAPIDVADDSSRLQTLMSPLQSPEFMEGVASDLLKSGKAAKLVLMDGPGSKIRVLLNKFGILALPKVDVKSLTVEELASHLEAIVSTSPNTGDRAIDIRTLTLDPETAYIVNDAVLRAFVKAAAEADRKELNGILDLFAEQSKTTEAKLQELETKLADFLKANPNLSNDAAAAGIYTEYSRLRMKKLGLEKSIESSKALLKYLKTKWSSADPDAIANFETLEQLQKDLVALKYSRLKLKQLHYADDNPGVQELDQKIENAENFIKQLKTENSAELATSGARDQFQKDPTVAKLSALQESILKDEYELKSTDDSLAALELELADMPQKGIFRNYLKREIEAFSTVYAEMFKRWQIISMRSLGEKGSFFIAQEPSMPKAPVNLPFGRKFLFSIFIGLAFALSIVLILESLSPKIIERGDLEAGGFVYAGRYTSSAASRAEILGTMQCLPIDQSESGKTNIILCASPSPEVDIRYFEPLAKYLAERSRKALLVAVGQTAIPEGYEKVSTSRFAHFFQYPGGNEDLIWVLDNDAFDAVKSVLDKYKSQYHTVFLFVQGAYESSIYSLSQKMADKLFLLGAVGAHTLKDYKRLTHGFEKPEQLHVALLSSYGSERLQPNYKNVHQKVIQKLFRTTFNSPVPPTDHAPPPPAPSEQSSGANEPPRAA